MMLDLRGEVNVKACKASDRQHKRNGDDEQYQIGDGSEVGDILTEDSRVSDQCRLAYEENERLTTTCPPSNHLYITYPVSSTTNPLRAVA